MPQFPATCKYCRKTYTSTVFGEFCSLRCDLDGMLERMQLPEVKEATRRFFSGPDSLAALDEASIKNAIGVCFGFGMDSTELFITTMKYLQGRANPGLVKEFAQEYLDNGHRFLSDLKAP